MNPLSQSYFQHPVHFGRRHTVQYSAYKTGSAANTATADSFSKVQFAKPHFGTRLEWEHLNFDELHSKGLHAGNIGRYIVQILNQVSEVTYQPDSNALHITGQDGAQAKLILDRRPQNPKALVAALKASPKKTFSRDGLGFAVETSPDDFLIRIDNFELPKGWLQWDRIKVTNETVEPLVDYLNRVLPALETVTYDPQQDTLHLMSHVGTQAKLVLAGPLNERMADKLVNDLKVRPAELLGFNPIGFHVKDPMTGQPSSYITHLELPVGWNPEAE